MFCTKCGYQNIDGAAFCVNCGNNLQNSGVYQQPQPQYSQQGYYHPQTAPYAPYKPQRSNKSLMIGLIIGGVVLVAGIILLIVLLSGNTAGNGVLGMWYEETGHGTMNFNSNGTVDMSVMGISVPADYTFNQSTGEGEMSLYGSTTSFYVKGGELNMQGATYTRNAVEQQNLDYSDYELPDLDLSDFGY